MEIQLHTTVFDPKQNTDTKDKLLYHAKQVNKAMLGYNIADVTTSISTLQGELIPRSIILTQITFK